MLNNKLKKIVIRLASSKQIYIIFIWVKISLLHLMSHPLFLFWHEEIRPGQDLAIDL